MITMKYVPGRTAAAGAVTAALLSLTACNAAEPASPGAAGRATSPEASATAGLAEECKAAVTAFKDLFKGMIMNSAAEGAEKQAAFRKALTDYAAGARAQAAKISDPALRAAVENQAAAAEKLSGSADPTALEDPDFEKATAGLEKVCADAVTPTASPGTPTVRLGAAGSACDLPVAFDLVALWKPEAVDIDEFGELASMYRNGSFEVVCEVDAKPAGDIGFLRVYVSKSSAGDPRSSLESFVAADFPEARKAGNLEVRQPKYTELTIGGQPAAEATWESYNKSMDHLSKYSAFALKTPRGAVVVRLSPFGADEHPEVLPAFELAKKSLTVN
ncbi:lipoprotein [Actinoplanes sp. NEAU-A12]|uniref:Lipoprotein n=1 Tax=Actinoplanes sandaracinus TaxID=3045177 RepID=A0ABT6X147_9ACTN|nr:lipoprotein [Actinoplanes sandaracinus]MDI6105634.1 lipoprotein [Actinoplanes sandaracinus]